MPVRAAAAATWRVWFDCTPPIETSVSQPLTSASATRYSSLRVLLPPNARPLLQSSRLAQSCAPPRCALRRSRRCTGDGPKVSGWRAKASSFTPPTLCHARPPQRGQHPLAVDADRPVRVRARVVLQHDDGGAERLDLADALRVLARVRPDDEALLHLLVRCRRLAVLVDVGRHVDVRLVDVVGLRALPLAHRLEGGVVVGRPREAGVQHDLPRALADVVALGAIDLEQV